MKLRDRRAILTEMQAIDIFKVGTSHDSTTAGITASSVAKKYGINERTVRDIWKRRTWTRATGSLEGITRSKLRSGRPKGSKDIMPRKPKKKPTVMLDTMKQQHCSLVSTKILYSHTVQNSNIPGLEINKELLDPFCWQAKRQFPATPNRLIIFDHEFGLEGSDAVSEAGSIDAALHSWTLQPSPWIERLELFLQDESRAA